MSAASGRASHPQLIADRAACGWFLRQRGAAEAARLALAIVWTRSTEAEARRELASHLAGIAGLAGIRPSLVKPEHLPSCRELAASMLGEELDRLDAEHLAVLERMVLAVPPERSREGQWAAAAAVAREAGVPPYMIAQAVRWAKARRRGRGG